MTMLDDAGFGASLTPVVAVEIPDRPGGLADVLEALGRAGMNVEYAYCFVEPSGAAAVDIFKVDAAGADDVLSAAGFRVLDAASLVRARRVLTLLITQTLLDEELQGGDVFGSTQHHRGERVVPHGHEQAHRGAHARGDRLGGPLRGVGEQEREAAVIQSSRPHRRCVPRRAVPPRPRARVRAGVTGAWRRRVGIVSSTTAAGSL